MMTPSTFMERDWINKLCESQVKSHPLPHKNDGIERSVFPYHANIVRGPSK